MNYKEKYKQWLNSDFVDEDLKDELRGIKDEKDIEERFYKNLQFGTGGLRGIMGAGTNRMNKITVSQATQGFSDYLNNNFKSPSVAIGYDSRNMSKEFAEITALTFVGNGIKVYLYEELEPTPILSYAVRELKCSGGVVITASHNTKEYNGYKVYDEFGGQVTDKKANEIINCVEKVESFKHCDKKDAIDSKKLVYIGEEVLKSYMEKVKGLTIRKEMVKKYAKELKIIYTPIHGSGNIPVRRALKELGYKNVVVVKEQEKPNGDFPTVIHPNPENPKVFKIALEMAKEENPDMIFGTDPDCDRIGIIAKNKDGEYKVLTGNQTGLLLTDYILKSLKENNELKDNSFIVKTIVTTEAVKEVAKDYNVEVIDVLTGFKYIGEKIREESDEKNRQYLFGFEESYGCLKGEFVRDKDAVIASTIIAEMTLYYKIQGLSLFDALENIYKKYGFFEENLVSIELEGKEGEEKIANWMTGLRNLDIEAIYGKKLKYKFDFMTGYKEDYIEKKKEKMNYPKSNVLKFIFEDNYSFVIRPSGTEAKIKIYFSIKENREEDLKENMENFKEEVQKIINKSE